MFEKVPSRWSCFSFHLDETVGYLHCIQPNLLLLVSREKKRPQIMSDVDDFNLDTLDAEEESEEDDEPSEVCQSIDKSCVY